MPSGATDLPVTSGQATQTIQLQEGINWVGLNVYPEVTSMSELLAPIADQLVLVKDSDGRHYVPSFDAGELTDWEWNRGYIVKVSASTTLTVTGALIVAGSSLLSLGSGYSIVPFFGDEPIPTVQAFASLGEHLVEARDSADNVYSPGDSNPSLLAAEPGHAYQVLLSSPATLIYGGSFGDVVSTRAELLALPTADLALGSTVVMAGYHYAGDGGGGVFTLVDEGAYGCDAGYVLCPLDQLGPMVTDNTTFTNSWSTRQFNVSQPPVAFGSLALNLSATNAGGDTWSISIPDDYMHGTTHQSRDAWTRTFNHQSGQFRENRDPGGRPMGRFLSAHLGDGFEAQAQFSYRRVEGGLRWVRTHDIDGVALPPSNQVWDARWFGCRSHDDAPYFDNTNCLNWALVLARYTNLSNPGRVAEVRLTHNGTGPTTYYYSKSIQIPEGMALTGDAGAHIVDATDDFGNTVHPVRPRHDAVILKRLPESAAGCDGCGHVFDHLDMRRPYGHPDHLPPSPAVLLGNTTTSIQPETGILAWSVRDLVLDGNKDGQDIWADRFSSSDREGYLRNSPGYSGLAQSIHGGKDVSGQNLTVERSYITGYAATGVLTSNHADTTYFYDVSIGDAAYNHAGYLQSPTYAVNIGTHGEAWGHFEIAGGYFENLVAEHLLPGRSGANGLFSWRGGDFDTVELCLNNSNRACGSEVVGLYADMRGGNRSFATQGLGPGIHISNATIIKRPDANTVLWHENGNGYQSARYHDFTYSDVRFFLSNGSSGEHMIRVHTFEKSYFKNINIANNASEAGWSSVFRLDARDRTGSSTAPFGVIYSGLGSAPAPLPTRDFARGYFSTENVQHRFFVTDSHFDTHGVIRGHGASSGTGRLRSVCPSDDPCGQTQMAQIYLADTHIRAGSNQHSDGELFFEVTRFSNVTDPSNGATSEDSGTFTCDGGTVYERPTNLFWRPHATRGRFDVTGGPSVAEVEFVNSSGQVVGPRYLYPDSDRDARQPIARITFSAPCPVGTQVSWGAAVSEWVDHEGQPVSIPDWYPY